MRRPSGYALAYVLVSGALAAAVWLAGLTYSNGQLALLVLNLPGSIFAICLVYYVLAVGVVMFGYDANEWCFRIAYFAIWMTMLVVQASAFQAVRRGNCEAAGPGSVSR
jgi:purine-cytosine permease-like protein